MSNQLGASFSAQRPRELFNERIFHVPDYQRGYSWERQQWQEFVDDIDLLPAGREHYTGTVVLQSTTTTFRDLKGKPSVVYDVVDGQQRLTTLVLLMDAVRRKLVEAGEPELAQGIAETFLFAVDRNKQIQPRLRLGSDTHDYFARHVLHDEPWLEGNRVRAHRNLDGGKTFFADFLNQKRSSKGDGFREWLLDFRDKVSDQLVLTVYPVGKESDAGVIFEAMNNRGKPITELEKVKNYLLYLASKLDLPDDHQLGKRINETWAYVFQRLMSSGLATPDGEDQLLRVHWLMAHDPVERNWKGSKSLKALYNLKDFEGKHDELLDRLVRYVTDLRRACTAFCDVAHPRHPDAFTEYRNDPKEFSGLLNAAERLPRLRTLAAFLPLLVAVRLRFPGDVELYRAVADRCEKYAFRVYRLLQRRAQTGRSTLFLKANQTFSGAKAGDALIAELDGLILYYSKAGDIERAWTLAAETNWYGWSGLRYLLYEYETHLCELKGRTAKASWSEIEKSSLDHTIEHVLPQTPKDGYWTERFDAAARKLFTHDLGNLCLTLDNASYGNKPFLEKKGHVGLGKRCYAEGDLLQERELAGYDEWNANSIKERREKIVEWAKGRWAVAGASEPPTMLSVVGDDDDSDALELDEP